MSIYYIYRLVHIETKQFYYGSRTGKRKKLDPYEDLPSYKSSSKEVHALGFENFYYGVVETYNDRIECLMNEHRLIRATINHPLSLNIHYLTEEGARRWKHHGQGFQKGKPAWNSGKKNVYTKETLAKMKASQKGKHTGKKNGMLGRKHTKSAKLQMSIGHKGKPAWNKGIPRKLWSPNQ